MDEAVFDSFDSNDIDKSGISVHAGFPNPAAERGSGSPLSLDRLLIRHPSSTYLFRIRGHAWEERGIFDGDIALIDRATNPQPSDLVATWQDDTFALTTLKNLSPLVDSWGTLITIIHQFYEK